MEKRDPEPSLHTCAMGVWSSDFVEHLNCSSLEEVCFSVWSSCLQPNPVSSSITDMNDPDSTHRHDWPRLRPHTDMIDHTQTQTTHRRRHKAHRPQIWYIAILKQVKIWYIAIFFTHLQRIVGFDLIYSYFLHIPSTDSRFMLFCHQFQFMLFCQFLCCRFMLFPSFNLVASRV